ncbi:MAG: ferritin-like domain-containing protein [Clostridiales bacterium]|nr:ferritin-like domain-containing protein [Clostridiales bacterium]
MDTYTSLSPDQKILDILCAAAEAEQESVHFFGELIKLFKDGSDKENLRLIRIDEQRHEKYFCEIHKFITGSTPVIAQRMPRGKLAGLTHGGELAQACEKAMYSALENVEFYRLIHSSFSNHNIRETLFEIMTDEQNIAIKMSHLYQKIRSTF